MKIPLGWPALMQIVYGVQKCRGGPFYLIVAPLAGFTSKVKVL